MIIISYLFLFLIIGVSIYAVFGIKVIADNKVGAFFRGGKFQNIRKPGKIHFMIPFYDVIKMVNFEPKDLNIPQKMIIASDKEKLYVNGSLTIKMKDPEKAYTAVKNFEDAVIAFIDTLLEEELTKTTFGDIKTTKRDFDNKILEAVKTKIDQWGLEARRIKLNIDRER